MIHGSAFLLLRRFIGALILRQYACHQLVLTALIPMALLLWIIPAPLRNVSDIGSNR